MIKQKVLTLLVLLMTAVTGAVAQTTYTVEISGGDYEQKVTNASMPYVKEIAYNLIDYSAISISSAEVSNGGEGKVSASNTASKLTISITDAFSGQATIKCIMIYNDGDGDYTRTKWVYVKCRENVPASGTCGTDVTWYLDNGEMTISGTGAMDDCTNVNYQPWKDYRNDITSVVVSEGVTYIGGLAFGSCRNITSISLPESLTSIGERAFYGCNNEGLTSLTIPDNVATIGDYAFIGCFYLSSLTIGNSVTTIGNSAFSNCGTITTVDIPNSVTTIGNYAFSSCSSLQEIVIPSSVTTIGSGAFYGCYKLQQIVIPNSVTSIGENAFQGCSQLETMTIGSGVESIGNGTFQDCTKLSTVIINNGVKTIGNNAFSNCPLTSVSIPGSVTTIGASAFSGCSLTSVSIPGSVTTIGASAFSGCNNLTAVTLSSNPIIGVGAFPAGATVTMNLTAGLEADNAHWTTFYNENYGFQTDENTQVFKVKRIDTKLTMNEVESKIVDSGTPVVLKSSTGSLVMTLTTSTSSDTQTNHLTGVSVADGVESVGTYFVLDYTAGNGLAFYKQAAEVTIPANTAYIAYDGDNDFLPFGSEESPEPAGYAVSLKAETADEGNWTAKAGEGEYQSLPLEGVAEGTQVSLKYAGTKLVKSVKAVKKGGAAPAGNSVDLSTLTADYEAQDGDVLTGSTSTYSVTIADGATVTLDGVNISSDGYCIKCAGDATIILKDGSTNTLTGTGDLYPALSIGDANTTLTIQGSTGVLNVTSGDYCAGIGGGYKNTNNTCGNIKIEGGVITAQGGNSGAGIGTDCALATCGDIIITGGTVTATGGTYAAGIGTGDGDQAVASCGSITITNGVTKVTAAKGAYAPNSIGKGNGSNASCGTVTIGGTGYGTDGISTSPYTYQPSN